MGKKKGFARLDRPAARSSNFGPGRLAQARKTIHIPGEGDYEPAPIRYPTEESVGVWELPGESKPHPNRPPDIEFSTPMARNPFWDNPNTIAGVGVSNPFGGSDAHLPGFDSDMTQSNFDFFMGQLGGGPMAAMSARLNMLDYISTGLQYPDEFFDLIRQIDEKYDTGILPEREPADLDRMVLEMSLLNLSLAAADDFWVSPEVSEGLQREAHNLPEDATLEYPDLPRKCGWITFSRPWEVPTPSWSKDTTARTALLHVLWVSTEIIPDYAATKPAPGPGVVRFFLYGVREGARAIRRENVDMDFSLLEAIGTADWKIGGKISELRQHNTECGAAGAVAAFSMFHFARQRISKVSRYQADRATRRRHEREGKAQPNISVIQLRAVDYLPHKGRSDLPEEGRHVRRHAVRGFWTSRWVGERHYLYREGAECREKDDRQLVPIWIDPYVRGSGPGLIAPHKLFSVSR